MLYLELIVVVLLDNNQRVNCRTDIAPQFAVVSLNNQCVNNVEQMLYRLFQCFMNSIDPVSDPVLVPDVLDQLS
jgi:hypothetical protein